MEKKLYRVKVCLYVMAENEYDACWAATNAKFDVFECTADKAKAIDPGWEDAVPYNAEDDRTCSEILANKMRVIRSRVRAVKSDHLWTVNAKIPSVSNRTKAASLFMGRG